MHRRLCLLIFLPLLFLATPEAEAATPTLLYRHQHFLFTVHVVRTNGESVSLLKNIPRCGMFYFSFF